MVWQRSSVIGMDRILSRKEPCSCFVGNVLTGARGFYGWGRGFLLLYKRFEDGRLSWPRNIQEAAELTEDQYRYLMTGLNPLDPRIKDVDPKHIY